MDRIGNGLAARAEGAVVLGLAPDTSQHVVEWAATQAWHRGHRLLLLHAVHERHPADPTELLERTTAWAHRVQPATVVDTVVTHQDPRSSLHQAAQRAELLVLGVHPHGGVPALSLASTSLAVAGHAVCPVVVVPPVRAFPGHGVVVGVDGSPAGQDALAFAVQHAEDSREELTVVHVWDRLVSGPPTSSHREEDREWSGDEASHALLLAEAVAGCAQEHPDLVVHRRLVRHPVPAFALLQEAERAQLLVVGARGRGTLASVVLGSVDRSVLQTTTVPVAVVPHRRVRAGADADRPRARRASA